MSLYFYPSSKIFSQLEDLTIFHLFADLTNDVHGTNSWITHLYFAKNPFKKITGSDSSKIKTSSKPRIKIKIGLRNLESLS